MFLIWFYHTVIPFTIYAIVGFNHISSFISYGWMKGPQCQSSLRIITFLILLGTVYICIEIACMEAKIWRYGY